MKRKVKILLAGIRRRKIPLVLAAFASSSKFTKEAKRKTKFKKSDIPPGFPTTIAELKARRPVILRRFQGLVLAYLDECASGKISKETKPDIEALWVVIERLEIQPINPKTGSAWKSWKEYAEHLSSERIMV